MPAGASDHDLIFLYHRLRRKLLKAGNLTESSPPTSNSDISTSSVRCSHSAIGQDCLTSLTRMSEFVATFYLHITSPREWIVIFVEETPIHTTRLHFSSGIDMVKSAASCMDTGIVDAQRRGLHPHAEHGKEAELLFRFVTLSHLSR